MNSLTLPKITYENIKKIILLKNYPFNETNLKLNHVGIRSDSSDMIVNTFDDFVCYLRKDKTGTEGIIIASATTIPGSWFLDTDLSKQYGTFNELNLGGTATVVPGFYPAVWQLGTLWGFDAFTQVGNLKCYRQKELDDKLHLDPSTITEGNNYGIDNHSTNMKYNMVNVDNWSAGCQTVNDIDKFKIAIECAKEQIANTQFKLFDYYLLEEKDFTNL
jgi:hypothetical protein